MKAYKLLIAPALIGAFSLAACADDPYEDENIGAAEEQFGDPIGTTEQSPTLQDDELRDIQTPPAPLDDLEDDTLGTVDNLDPNADDLETDIN